jgi:hypothetical protein
MSSAAHLTEVEVLRELGRSGVAQFTVKCFEAPIDDD